MTDILTSPPWLFSLAFASLLVAMRSRLPWTRVGGAALAALAAAGLAIVVADPTARTMLFDPQRAPLLAVLLASCTLLWREMSRLHRQAPDEDASPDHGNPNTLASEVAKPSVHRTGLSPPEMTAALLAVAMVAVLAYLFPPVSGPMADPHQPVSARAPWYLLALQELRIYLAPPWATILVPLLTLAGLFMLPFLEPRTEQDETAGSHQVRTRRRRPRGPRSRLMVFVGTWFLIWMLPAVFAGWLREPNALPPAPAFSELFWGHWLDLPMPRAALVRELPGLTVLAGFFGLIPYSLLRWRGSRGFLERYRDRLGSMLFTLAAALVLLLLAVPLKMYGRWLFGIGDLVHLPEWALRF